jgi:4-alpha-glucanotransferase
MANLLQTVARLYNIQAKYRDGFGQLRTASPESVLSALHSLGAPVRSHEDLPGALRERRQSQWQRCIEPVTVVWQDHPLKIKLRLPGRCAQDAVLGEITLENGERLECRCEDVRGDALFKDVEGARYVVRVVRSRAAIPDGYHRLHLRVGNMDLQSMLISAPLEAYAPPQTEGKRWGVFCPLYALNSGRCWGAGDFTDLATFARFVGKLKGQAVATLPLLASFLDEPFNPSPYAPVSRLFWNEFYLDVTKIPEFAQSAGAQTLVGSGDFQRDLNAARDDALVGYRRVMALKRRVLQELLKSLLTKPSRRRTTFKKYVATHPLARDYAAFRAKVERERTVWLRWPSTAGAGTLTPDDYDESAYQYHLYVQWQCEEQKRRLRDAAKHNGATLYLDFPLGVNRDGYDVWRERELFALGANGGAPPDGLFVKGQNWGFPPLNPEAVRRRGPRYYIHCVRHHMALAGMLRIDHVMGLHRAFWVPDGFSATDGLYVHHRAEEYWAILSLESHRHQTQVVGENLGTVPFYVNEAMARHKILGMHVGIFGVNANADQVLDLPPPNTVASLNTHDTATFMGFWTGADVQDRVALGLLDESQAHQELQYRAAQRDALTGFLRSRGLLRDSSTDPADVLAGWLCFLAQNNEEFLLISLEDLWLETQPQNVPGTWQERPNWQRKARHSLEALREMKPITDLLKSIGDIRGAIS